MSQKRFREAVVQPDNKPLQQSSSEVTNTKIQHTYEQYNENLYLNRAEGPWLSPEELFIHTLSIKMIYYLLKKVSSNLIGKTFW